MLAITNHLFKLILHNQIFPIVDHYLGFFKYNLQMLFVVMLIDVVNELHKYGAYEVVKQIIFTFKSPADTNSTFILIERQDIMS